MRVCTTSRRFNASTGAVDQTVFAATNTRNLGTHSGHHTKTQTHTAHEHNNPSPTQPSSSQTADSAVCSYIAHVCAIASSPSPGTATAPQLGAMFWHLPATRQACWKSEGSQHRPDKLLLPKLASAAPISSRVALPHRLVTRSHTYACWSMPKAPVFHSHTKAVSGAPRTSTNTGHQQQCATQRSKTERNAGDSRNGAGAIPRGIGPSGCLLAVS